MYNFFSIFVGDFFQFFYGHLKSLKSYFITVFDGEPYGSLFVQLDKSVADLDYNTLCSYKLCLN